MSNPRIRAPELPDSLEWFNTDTPLRLADQRGKVVLLDFWTYCCVNCMHVLPDLAWLERKYGDRLMVIGVHSPKFPNERVAENVQKAINRHYIRHAVVNDPGLTLWKKYAIKAWPSIIFIDPEGYIVGVLRGEGRRKQLDQMIESALQQADKKGLSPTTSFRPTMNPEPARQLKFPGKILVRKERLWISDTGHNRILECMPNGRILRSYGTNSPGLVDGSPIDVSFTSPQGMCVVEGHLYIADTGNHAIRKIDLTTYEVETVAGNGKRAKAPPDRPSNPVETSLNSPWDLAYHNRILYIAMAGSHQLWQLSLTNEMISVCCGNGREGIVDGSPDYACYAQPSGMSVGEDIEPVLFIADAETSAIRAMRFRDGHTRTLVGKGLFEFGDKDGKGRESLLQHPMCVSYDPQRKGIWIADTFNNKIKFMNLTQQQVTTLKIDCHLNEPAGVCVQGNILYIANTNDHQVLQVDLTTREVNEIEIFSVESE